MVRSSLSKRHAAFYASAAAAAFEMATQNVGNGSQAGSKARYDLDISY
jgi:hypothetical protein